MAKGVVESKEEMEKKMQKKRLEKEKPGPEKEFEEVKEGASEKKEDITNKIEEVKEGASEKKEDIEEKAGEVKEEVEVRKEKLEKESEAEGVNPAEKLLNDIISGLRQRTGEVSDYVSDYTTESKAMKKPLVDVLETNDTILVIADLPGVKRDDVEIGISKNSVEITAMFKEKPEVENAKFTINERSYGKTHRSIILSTEVKVKEATAKYGECTVTITLPKMVEDITKVKIED